MQKADLKHGSLFSDMEKRGPQNKKQWMHEEWMIRKMSLNNNIEARSNTREWVWVAEVAKEEKK
jgi:hypothetical protein